MSKKLVLFGDSFFGRCGSERIALLETMLNKEYDVYNCAAGGWNSEDMARKAKYIASLKPDTVIISVGTNDVSPWHRVEFDTFITNLGVIIDTFTASRIVFFPPAPIHPVSFLAEAHITNDEVKRYGDALIDVCDHRSVAYIDSWKIFKPLLEKGKSYHVEDGVHFNEFGYETLFDELSKVVKS